MQGTSLFLTANRTFSTLPYITSQDYVGNFIILSLLPQETKSNAWTINFMGSQGIRFLKGKLNVRAMYNNLQSQMIQNKEIMPFNTNILTLKAGLTVGVFSKMDLGYNLNYTFHQSEMPALSTTSTLNNWEHNAYLTFSLAKNLSVTSRAEYYHNQIEKNKFKDIFFTDIAMKYAAKKFDITMELNNILNKKNYGYGINGAFVHSYSNLNIRGRELMVTLYYKP